MINRAENIFRPVSFRLHSHAQVIIFKRKKPAMLEQLNRSFHSFNDLRNYLIRFTLKDHTIITGYLVAVEIYEENTSWIYPRYPEKQFVICSVKMKNELERCLYNLKTLPSNIRIIDHENVLKMEVLLPSMTGNDK